MKIGNQKVVSLTYELREDNEQGELIQKVNEQRPFVYLFGVGGLLPKFEQNLEGLTTGDKFQFSMTAEESYGNHTEEAIIDLEKSLFEVDGIQIGASLQLTNGERVRYFPGDHIMPPDLGTRMYEMTCEYCCESCGWSSVENAKGVCGPCSEGLWIDPYFS